MKPSYQDLICWVDMQSQEKGLVENVSLRLGAGKDVSVSHE